MVKTAVYYGRVSTSEQAESGLSLAMMKDEAKKWATKNDYEIVEFFEDNGITGTNYKKLKELQRLHKYIKNHDVNAIICWRLDRISRNDTEFYTYTMSLVESLNMTIVSTSQFPDIRDIPRVLIGVYLGLATDEVNNTKKRTKDTMQHRAEQGYLLGKAPIGYLNKRKDGHGIIVIDEVNAKYVKKAFELYATGLYTMKMVSEKLYNMGFKNKHDMQYPVAKIEHILKDITYTGKFKYGKNDDGTDKIIQGVHEPIIPLSLFNKVQSMRRNDGKPNSKHSDKTYSKLIKCTCGCYLCGSHSKGAHNSGNYIYYRCTDKKRIHTSIVSIKQETLDEVFSEVFSSIHIPQKAVELLKPRIVRALDELYSIENQVYNKNINRLTELTTLIKKAHEERLLGKSPLSEEEFYTQMNQWQDEKMVISENIKKVSGMNKTIYSNISTIMKFLQNLPDTYANADTLGKQRLLRMIVDEVTYDTEAQHLSIKLKPIFQAFKIISDNSNNCSQKVTTLRKVSCKTLSEYLAENIELSLKNKVTTLESVANIKKEPHNETQILNGAGDGIRTHAYRNHNPRS